MNKLVTLSRLMCLTTALAGPVLMATPDIANAKRFGQHGASSHVRQGNSHPANITKRNGIRPRFAISGQNANVKTILRHRKEKSREADCKTNCSKPTQTTTKGNPAQPTGAGNMTPAVNIRPASKTGVQPGVKERFYTAVREGNAALKAATLVPPIVGLTALPIALGAAPAMGVIEHKDPILGPVKGIKRYLEDVASFGNEIDIASWF
jgi:hypothetical protein